MNVYKVCVYTNSQRLECRQHHYGAADARTQFQQICTVFADLPMDAICSFEQNSQTLEAYRFTRTFNTFRVDVQSPSFNVLCARYMGVHVDYLRDSFDDLLPRQIREFSPLSEGTTMLIAPPPSPVKKTVASRIRDLWRRIVSSNAEKTFSDALVEHGFSRP